MMTKKQKGRLWAVRCNPQSHSKGRKLKPTLSGISITSVSFFFSFLGGCAYTTNNYVLALRLVDSKIVTDVRSIVWHCGRKQLGSAANNELTEHTEQVFLTFLYKAAMSPTKGSSGFGSVKRDDLYLQISSYQRSDRVTNIDNKTLTIERAGDQVFLSMSRQMFCHK